MEIVVLVLAVVFVVAFFGSVKIVPNPKIISLNGLESTAERWVRDFI